MILSAVAILIQSLGLYALYNTSQRADLRKDTFSIWLQSHRAFSKSCGLFLLIIAYVTLIASRGLAAGLLTATVLLMTIIGMIVVLAPIKFKA